MPVPHAACLWISRPRPHRPECHLRQPKRRHSRRRLWAMTRDESYPVHVLPYPRPHRVYELHSLIAIHVYCVKMRLLALRSAILPRNGPKLLDDAALRSTSLALWSSSGHRALRRHALAPLQLDRTRMHGRGGRASERHGKRFCALAPGQLPRNRTTRSAHSCLLLNHCMGCASSCLGSYNGLRF